MDWIRMAVSEDCYRGAEAPRIHTMPAFDGKNRS